MPADTKFLLVICIAGKKQYAKGGFRNEASNEPALEERVRQLEQILNEAYVEKHVVNKSIAPNLRIIQE